MPALVSLSSPVWHSCPTTNFNRSRLDLRPQADKDKDGNPSAVEDAALPPPLDIEVNDGEETSANRKRTSRFFDLNRLRHASAQERIEVLRQYRTEQPDGGASADLGAEDRSRKARVADKLRDKFRIRTRAQSPSNSRRGS